MAFLPHSALIGDYERGRRGHHQLRSDGDWIDPGRIQLPGPINRPERLARRRSRMWQKLRLRETEETEPVL